MNLVRSCIQLRALASTSLLVATLSVAAPRAKEYENFELPKAGGAAPTAPDAPSLNYQSNRIKLTGRSSLRESSVNAQTYLFAKEAFLTEKRDEAIKLLRQELDSGFTRNRDNLLLKLGQLYAEKYMELSYRENEYYTKELDAFDKKKLTDKNAKPPKLDQSRSQAYLKQALEIFVGIEKDYPKHPKIDEILFFIGFVEMEYGKTDKGLRYLERVVREFPRSRKFDEALLYLGDYHFEKGKFREALSRYQILSRRKDSALYHYAMYKIAWCELNTSEQRKGLRDMKALIADLQGSKEPSKFNLREQALRDLVVFYGETGDVDDAIAYFREQQGNDKALSNLRVLADLLRGKARDDAAARAYQKLLEEFPDGVDAPKLYVGLAETQARLNRTRDSVATLVKAIKLYNPNSDWYKRWSQEKAGEAKDGVDTLSNEALKLAFYYHSSAQKSSNKVSREFALILYRSISQNFPQHPERKKIAFYTGEILYAEGKWLEAAEYYMLAAKTPPKDKIADESAYNALLALDRITAKNDNLQRYSKEDQKKIDLTPQDIPQNEQKFIEVAQFYMKEYPQGSRVVDVEFRIAAIYYRYHHFDQAQQSFKDIALKHPSHRSATTAANIVLDIYNLKKDYVALDATAGVFANTKNLGDKAFRAEMAKISGEIAFKKLEGLEGTNQWKEAGEAYFAFYKSNPNGELAEKALNNAQVSFEKAGDLTRSLEVTKLFIAKYPESDNSKRFLLSLAKQSEKAYDFETAQKLYEDFHKKYPKDKEARKALFNAAVFAELLERNKTALSLYDEYLKDRSVPAEDRRAILVSQAKIHRKDGKWEQVNKIYRQLIRDANNANDKFSILGELARQYERGGRVADRDKVVNELRYTYDNTKGIKASGPAFNYVAEAKFRAIAKQREAYEKVKLRFPPEDLVYLLGRKQKMLAKLATAYDAVAAIGVPDWGVAALYEKGEAFDNFVQNFKGLQIPARYKDAERTELESQLKIIEGKLVAPIAVKAQEILASCVKRGSEFFVANEYASKCRQRLEKGKFVDPAGLMPQPSYWTTRWTGGGEVAKK